jgi:hypothetical protein
MFVHVRRQANEFEFSDVSLSALEMVCLLHKPAIYTLTLPKAATASVFGVAKQYTNISYARSHQPASTSSWS